MKQLPVFATVGASVGYTFSNIYLLLKASMFWVLLYIIVIGGFIALGGAEYLENSLAQYKISFQLIGMNGDVFIESMRLDEELSNLTEKNPILINSFIAIDYLLMFMAYYSIAVSWHRACLLDELPPMLRFGKLELNYFGSSLWLIFAIGVIMLALGMYMAVVTKLMPSLGASIMIVSVFTLIIMSVRFVLVFPGIAVGDRRMNFGYSWKNTKDNTWRLFGGTFLVVLATIPISIAFGLLSSIGLPLIISMPIQFVVQLLIGAFILSYMSMCYQHFIPSPNVGDLV